jgi:hypothetical protein
LVVSDHLGQLGWAVEGFPIELAGDVDVDAVVLFTPPTDAVVVLQGESDRVCELVAAGA